MCMVCAGGLVQCTVYTNQGSIEDFDFAREGKWDAQTMHLLSFSVSATNVTTTKKSIGSKPTGCIREAA